MTWLPGSPCSRNDARASTREAERVSPAGLRGSFGVYASAWRVWRLAPLHLPQFAFKYGGSALWATAVYWLLALLFAWTQPGQIAWRAGVLALAVEVAKLLRWDPLDRFRETLAGRLLLGRYFSWSAVAAYWLAIASVTLFDHWFRPGRGPSRPRPADRHAPN